MDAQQTGTSVPPLKSLITDSAIVIAVVTAAAYFFALRFESGMCNYFNIPIYFLSLNPTMVMFRSTKFIYMIFIASVLLIVLSSMARICVDNPKNHKLIAGLLIITFILQIFFSIYHEIEWADVITSVILVLVMGYILIFFPKCESNKMFKDLFPTYGAILLSISVFWLASSIIHDIGIRTASVEPEYPVISNFQDVPKVVVLRLYGDHLVTAPVDPSTKTVKRELYLLKTPEKGHIQLTSEIIGPLKVDRQSSPRVVILPPQ